MVKAARTEGDLEGDRLRGALAEELQAARARAAGVQPLAVVPEPPLRNRAAPVRQPAPVELAPEHAPFDFARPGPALDFLQHPESSEGPLSGADVRGANPDHLPLISALVAEREAQLRAQLPNAKSRRIDVLWVHSNDTHCVWCERRHAASPAARPREVICVAQIDRGKAGERWFFG